MGTKLIFKNGKFEWADPNMVDKQTITPQATPTLGNQLAYVGGKFVAADADYYDSELGKIPDFIKQSASDFKNYGYSSSDDVYNGIVSGVDNYKRTIENAKKYNPQWYENNKVNIDDTVKALDDVYNSYTNKKNTFGKYASEDEYNRDLYSYVYGDYTYDQLQREIAVLSGSQRRQSATESAKTQNKINVLKTLLYTNTYTDKDSYTKAITDIDKQISNINAELSSIEPDVVYSGSRGEGPVRDYTEEQSNKLSGLTQQRDYLKTTRAELEQKSKITDFTELPSKLGAANMAVFESNLDNYIHNPTGEEFKAVFEKMDTMPDGAEKDTLYYEGVPEIEDPVQFYLDNKDLIGENHQASSIGQYAIGLSVGETLGDLYWHARDFHWDQLKDEELLVYKFNLVKHGKEKALEYIRLLEPTLGQRYQAEVEKGFGDYMKEHGALAYIGLNALTVPMSMLGSVVGGIGLIDSRLSGETNPYSQANALRVGVNAIESATGKAIEENTDFTIGGRNVLAEAYNIGMSTAKSTFGALAFKQGYSFVAGLGAAADMAEDIYDRGGSSNQVFWGGVAAGVAETVFEYVSIDKLLDDSKVVDTAKKYFVNILVQAGVEASEEVFTEITNKIFDEMIMDEKSEFNQKVKQLVDSGMSLDEAREQAFTDVVYDVVWAGVAGFVSGGISSGGFGAVGYFSNSKNNAEIGKSIANNPLAITQLVGYAQSLNDPAINKMLKGKATNKNIGRIYNAVVENITDRFNNTSNNNEVVDTYNDIINNTKLHPLIALANELAEKQTRKYSKLYEADLGYIQSMEEGSDSGQQNPGQNLKNSIDDNNDDDTAESDIDSTAQNGYNKERGENYGDTIRSMGRTATGGNRNPQEIGYNQSKFEGNSRTRGIGKEVQRETAEDFVRRMEREAQTSSKHVTVLNRGSRTFAYSAKKVDNSNGGKATEYLESMGAKVVYCDGPIKINDGENTVAISTALTDPDGIVYVSSLLHIPAIITALHEIVHVKQRHEAQEYYIYNFALCSNLDMTSDLYREVATDIYIRHRLGNLTDAQIEKKWATKEQLDEHIKKVIYDMNNSFFDLFVNELMAYVNQDVSTDIVGAKNKYSGMFRDWNAVVEACRQFNKDIGADFLESASFMPETEQSDNSENDNGRNDNSDVEQDADVDSDKYAKDKSFWQAENKNKDAKISKTLKEKFASLFGKKTTDKPVSIGEIVKLIEKEFGVPISSGRFRHNAYGIYKNKSRAIRTKITNALPTIAHELGHHLDRLYDLHSLPSINEAMQVLEQDRPEFYAGYKENQRPREAAAEFLRVYLADRNLAKTKYPNFFKEFEATLNKSDLKNIQEIGDLINKYYTAAKSEAARAAVLTRTEARRIDRLGIRLSDLFERVITKLVDKARPIKKISKMAYDRFTYALKTTVRAKNSISGYYLSGLDGKPLNLKGDEYKSITDEEGNVLAFRYLFDKLQSNEQINDFRMYLVYKHAVEWLKQDKRVFADDAINNIDFVTQQIAELEAANPIFKETAERVYLWQRVFMQEYAVKSGLVKAETLDKLNQTYPCYIPFYRHVEKGGGGAKTSVANQKSLIKRAKGSGLELYDPFENIIVMVDRWMKAADRNAVMQEIAKTADTEEGLGYLLEKVDLKQMPNSVRTEIARNSFEGAMKDYLAEQGTDAKSTDNITKAILEVFDESVGESITEFKVLEFQGKSFATVMRNGKMEVYQIHDKNLLESVMGLSEANVGNILKVLGTLTRMMKALTTGVNAIWALTSNSIRDIQSAFMYSSNNNPASFTLDYIKAVGMVLKENFTNKTTETMKLYKTAGGGFNNSLSSDLKTIRATVNDIAGKPTFMERLKKLLNVLNHIENISDAIETAPRLAEFMRTYDKTKDAKKAILAAEEITVNFNRSGSFGKSVDQVIPYFNASVQGLNKLVTTLKNENGNRRAFIAKVISSAVITTLLQVAFMHIGGDDGEEEYAKLSSYKKNNFYNFYIGDGKFISISKPKELGLMASFMERTVEITTNEDADAKHEIEEYSAYAFDMLIPPLLDEAIVFGTIADIRANEDYKGTPIVSSYYESLLPEDQYNEKTSYLARILGDWFGYSPMKIDYIINSNLGVIGTLNQAFFSPEGDLTGGIKNKFYTDNAYSTDTFNKFYENAEKAAQTAASNPNDAEAIYRNKQYNSVKSVVSALNQYGKDLGLEREYKIYAQQYVADFEKNDQIDKRIVRLLNRTGDKDILYDKSFSATYSIDGVKHTIPAEQYLDYIDEYYAEIEKAYDEILRYGYSDERTVAMLKQAKSDVEKKLKKKYKTGE